MRPIFRLSILLPFFISLTACGGGSSGGTIPPGPSDGTWISRAELMQLPMTGPAWDALLADAQKDPGTPNVSDQNQNNDVLILAKALVCVRTQDNTMCNEVRRALIDSIGTEQGGRWLAVGRNLTAYVIAAGLLNLYADGDPNSDGSRVEAWIRSFLTMKLAHNTSGEPIEFIPFSSGSNASAQQGAAYVAIGAYLKDSQVLDRVWDAFRTYACGPTAPDNENINLSAGVSAGWAHDNQNPCAVNPLGTTKQVPAGRPGAGLVKRIDGAIINDIQRGEDYQWPPVWTQYPWLGLEGFVPAALILHRAGYPAFEVADQAVLRTLEYLWYLRQETGDTRWFDGERADETIVLVNAIYNRNFLLTEPATGGGRLLGYTDWTHGGTSHQTK